MKSSEKREKSPKIHKSLTLEALMDFHFQAKVHMFLTSFHHKFVDGTQTNISQTLYIPVTLGAVHKLRHPLRGGGGVVEKMT